MAGMVRQSCVARGSGPLEPAVYRVPGVAIISATNKRAMRQDAGDIRLLTSPCSSVLNRRVRITEFRTAMSPQFQNRDRAAVRSIIKRLTLL